MDTASDARLGEVEEFNLYKNFRYTPLVDGSPDYAPEHSENGRGFVIGGDNWQNRFLRRSLASPHQYYTVIESGNDWSIGSHVSMMEEDDRWMLVSTFVANELPSSGLFRDELFLVATDGSKRVRSRAHLHSVVRGVLGIAQSKCEQGR